MAAPVFDQGRSEGDLRRIRKAETVLSKRAGRLTVVLEAVYDVRNVHAVLRTCDCLGVQHVWVVEPITFKVDKHSKNVEGAPTKQGPGYVEQLICCGSADWLTIRTFKTTNECIEAARDAGLELWVTNLSQDAEAMTADWRPDCPDGGVAVVFGRETDGVSDEMLAVADRSIYFPIGGFTESFNISVAAAVILSTLLRQVNGITTSLPESEILQLREKWYKRLAKTSAQAELYESVLTSPPEPWSDLRWPDELRRTASNVPKRIREAEKQAAAELGMNARNWRVDQR